MPLADLAQALTFRNVTSGIGRTALLKNCNKEPAIGSALHKHDGNIDISRLAARAWA